MAHPPPPPPATFEDAQESWIRIVQGAERALAVSDGDQYRLSRTRTLLSHVTDQIQRSVPTYFTVNTASPLLATISRLDSALRQAIANSTDSTVSYTIQPASYLPSGSAGGNSKLFIHPDFLSLVVEEYGYGPSHISKILKRNGVEVSARTVRRRIIEQGLRAPNEPSKPVSTRLSEEEVDQIVLDLRSQQPAIGLRYLTGALRAEGIRIPRAVLRASVHRIDPFPTLFAETRRSYAQRRVYSNGGSNNTWHHDGQHGLIGNGIVIHGFIDGHSRLVTGLRASGNNRATTVLSLFLSATAEYGVPSRVRGDRGGENVQVAYWMERYRGPGRGSYLWGRFVSMFFSSTFPEFANSSLTDSSILRDSSPHNTRIERLWPEVTRLVTSKWQRFFKELEIEGLYNPDIPRHIWLGIFLFLDDINDDLKAFQNQHNQHPLSTANERSPVELFFESMVDRGVRGLWDSATQIDEDLQYVESQDEELGELERLNVNGHVSLEDARCPWGDDEEGWVNMRERMETEWTLDGIERWMRGQEAMLATMDELGVEM
ncbi:hypothetical protein JCM5353_004857 [Sporobolomyces roseus]